MVNFYVVKRVKDKSAEKDLLLNVKKTKCMVVDRDRDVKGSFMVDGEEIEEVDNFIYLGSTINDKGQCGQEIRR